MDEENELAVNMKWRSSVWQRPELRLTFWYVLAAIVWAWSVPQIIAWLPLQPAVKVMLIEWTPWSFVALAILFMYFFTRTWILRLRKARQLLHNYLDNSPTVHYELRAIESDFRAHWVSPNCERIMGYTQEEVKAPGWWLENIHPSDLKTATRTALRGFEGAQFIHEYRFRHEQGYYVWVRDELRRSSKRPLRFQGSWTNISADYIDNASSVAESVPEHGVLSGIALLDSERRVIAIDAPFTEISGLKESVCNNAKLEELLTAANIDSGDVDFPNEQGILIVGRNTERTRYSAILTIREALPDFCEGAAYIATLSDVTRMKQQQKQLQKLALFDKLTGLPNRNSLDLALAKLLDELPSDRLAAVIVLNINRFHKVNVQYGQHAGDKILQRLTQRLKKATPLGTKLYNLGGDEFAIIVNRVIEYIDIQNIILQIQSVYERPFVLASDDQQVYLTASMGTSVYPLDGHDGEKLLSQAKLAMHSAKGEHGKNQSYFKQEIESRAYDEIQLEEDVRDVLQTEQMQLVYQPMLNMDGQTIGVEALLRWEHPDFGTMKPKHFLPQFDANGLLDTLGIWVIKSVVTQVNIWEKQGIKPGKIAINLATEQISPQLHKIMNQLVERNPGLVAKIEFDLNESSLNEPLPDTLDIIGQLHELGVTLVIDRFGKGIGSMLHLKTMPIGKIKIDREFIRDLNTNERSTNLVRAIIHMTSELGLEVQAVGVENKAQLDKLREFGCHYWQGELYKLPQTAETVFTAD